MKEWKVTAILLCAFGLVKELQPSEFFMTEYLINHKHFSKETIVHVAYPVSTYTYFCVLPFIFLFTDYLKYRPIIYLEAASFIIKYALLIWGHNGLTTLKIIRIFHGVASSAEIAYLTYIYAKVDHAHYKKVTSYTHSAILIGNLIASIISQILISFQIMSFHDLNYISFGGVCAALVLATILPSTKESVYFNRRQSVFPTLTVPLHTITSHHVLNHLHNHAKCEHYELQQNNGSSSSNTSNSTTCSSLSSSITKSNNNIIADSDNTTNNNNNYNSKSGRSDRRPTLIAYEGQIVPFSEKRHTLGSIDQVRIIITKPPDSLIKRFRKAYRYLWKHFKEAYTNIYVFKWSLWWAIAMAGHLQVVEYYEALWEEIAPEQEHNVYNGAVNAVQCALSATLALAVGVVQIHWFKWGETVLCIISMVQGISLLWMSFTQHIMIAYVCYIMYRTLYQVLITVASAEIAEQINEDSHGLVFGFNTFIAVCIQTVLTIIVSDKSGLALAIRSEFFVYGCYYIILGFAFIFVAIYIFTKHGCIKLSWKLPKIELDV